MVLELSMEAVFAVCDVFWVARLGPEAVATVGLTEAMLTIIFAVATGLAMGTTALVSRRIGENNRPAAVTAAVQSIYLGIATAIPISLAGLLFAGPLLGLMGASSEVVEMGVGYNRVMLGGNVTILLLFLINGVFRGVGDAVIAMRSLWLANIINIILDPLLIFGWGPFPELGVTGAAVATTIARGLGVVYQVWMLASSRGRLRIRWQDLPFNLPVLWNLVKISLGGILQFSIATASWMALVRIIALFGSHALAGYTIAIRVIIFAILPSWGMANAAATLVGQNLGAGKPKRAEKSVWVTALANMGFLAGITLIFVFFAETITGWFTSEAAVIPYGVDCLRFISYGYVFYAWGMVITQAFNGAGDTYTPTLINLALYWCFQIPLAYILAIPVGLEAKGVFVAIAISESLLAVVAILVFRRGKWKSKKV
jgi:putative MATE family efflux protein